MAKILIIDDSATIRGQVREALDDFNVVDACDGLQGADILESDADICVAFCDINMPKMTGIEMLERVQGKTANPDVSIIMLTTESQSSQISQAKGFGAKGWIVKPFNPQQLATIAAKLSKASATRPTSPRGADVHEVHQ